MKQLTILAASDDSVIADATALLAEAGVNIVTITGEQYGAQAVVCLTVDSERDALAALGVRPDWQILTEDVLILPIRDEVGALARIARRLGERGITIRSIRFVERYNNHALVAIACGDAKAARSVLVGR